MNSQKILTPDLPVLVLVGPTAIGKTALSLDLSKEFNCEIVSVDSMQVYRYMDIGTAKATAAERAEVRHHLIDIIDPDEQYDAARFFQDAREAITAIHNRNKLSLLTGGTGLYLRALIDGLFTSLPIDPAIRDALKLRAEYEGIQALHKELSVRDQASALRIHPNDEQRILRALEILIATGIPWSNHLRSQSEEKSGGILQKSLQIGLTCDRETLYKRINDRCRQMLDNGLIEEVEALLSRGYDKRLNPMNAIGYRHVINYLEGKWSLQEAYEFLARDTRRYAKRQYTWFSKMSDIEWYASPSSTEVIERVNRWMGTY